VLHLALITLINAFALLCVSCVWYQVHSTR